APRLTTTCSPPRRKAECGPVEQRGARGCGGLPTVDAAAMTKTECAGRSSLPILVGMKLAEALALRADAARRAEQLRARIVAGARYQEGEPPAEDAAALLTEAVEVLGELESLIRRINRTNAGT